MAYADSSALKTAMLMQLFVCSFLTIFFAVVGAVIGFVPSLLRPAVYRSTTQLMLSTKGNPNDPEILPRFETIAALVSSVKLRKMVFKHPKVVPFHDTIGGRLQFDDLVLKSLIVESKDRGLPSAPLILVLHFDSPDRNIGKKIVSVCGDSLQKVFSRRQSAPREKTIELLSRERESVLSKLRNLERQHGDFLMEWPLEWGGGDPHRARAMELTQQLNEHLEQQQQKQFLQSQIEGLLEQSDDPEKAFEAATHIFADNTEEFKGAEEKLEASEKLEAVSEWLKVEVDSLSKQIAATKSQLEIEIEASAAVLKFKTEDKAFRDETERIHSLLKTLQEQLSRVLRDDEEARIEVVELAAPTESSRILPYEMKWVSVGAIVGLGPGLFGSALIFIVTTTPRGRVKEQH